MKHQFVRAGVAAIAILAMAGLASAQDYSFRFQSSDPAGNPNFEYQKAWTDLVKERSGGQVQID